jgi:hypothetical protein
LAESEEEKTNQKPSEGPKEKNATDEDNDKITKALKTPLFAGNSIARLDLDTDQDEGT